MIVMMIAPVLVLGQDKTKTDKLIKALSVPPKESGSLNLLYGNKNSFKL